MEEVVWGVVYFITAALAGTSGVIYYILRTAYIEMSDSDELQADRGVENGRNDFRYNSGS